MFNAINNNEGIIALPVTTKEVVNLVAKGTRKGIWQSAIRTTIGIGIAGAIGFGAYKLYDAYQTRNKWNEENPDDPVGTNDDEA